MELSKFIDVALDLDRVYAIQLTHTTRPESGHKQIPQLKIYLDIPSRKEGDFFMVTNEQAAEAIWKAIRLLPRFILNDPWAVDKSRIAWLEAKSSTGVFVLPSGGSEKLQLTPQAAKAILDSLP